MTQYGSSLPDGSHLEGPTKLDVLSDSVMDQSALNDLNDPEYDSCSGERVPLISGVRVIVIYLQTVFVLSEHSCFPSMAI